MMKKEKSLPRIQANLRITNLTGKVNSLNIIKMEK